MKAFLTGSRAYGTPRDDSDVDVVVLTSWHLMELLQKFADAQPKDENASRVDWKSKSLRFGKLNLVTTNDPETFAIWYTTTLALCRKKPVTKQDAVVAFRAALGMDAAVAP